MSRNNDKVRGKSFLKFSSLAQTSCTSSRHTQTCHVTSLAQGYFWKSVENSGSSYDSLNSYAGTIMARMWYLASLWLLSFTFRETCAEQAVPLLQKSGSNANFEWNFLHQNVTLFTVALSGNQTLFFASPNNPIGVQVDTKYAKRLNVSDIRLGKKVTFVLKNISAEDAGSYICTEGVSHDVIIPNCGQMLIVIEKPDNVTVVPRGTPVAGQRLELECFARSKSLPSNHGLKSTVLWLDSAGRTPSSPEAKVEDNRLVLSINRSDEGKQYACKVSDGLDVWSNNSQPFVLLPEYAPSESDIKFLPEQLVVKTTMGDTVQQICRAACRPNCTVIWQRSGENYVNETTDGFLKLAGIQRDKHGVHRCLATNAHGSTARSITIDILYAPGLHNTFVNGVPIERESVSEGDAVNISCTFDSNPAPVVTWRSQENPTAVLLNESFASRKPVSLIRSGMPRTLYTSSLVISQAACNQTGEYICKARNPKESVMDGTIHLFVKCVPRCNEVGGPSKMYLAERGKPLHIEFQVVGYPPPKIIRILSENADGVRNLEKLEDWSVKQKTDDKYPALNTLSLGLTEAAAANFDRHYYLTIENTEGSVTLAFWLRERGPPKQPYNLTYSEPGESSITLTWLAGFHGGESQRFAVEFKLAGDSDSNQWTSVTVPSQETNPDEGESVEMTVSGLLSATPYMVRVVAINQYGNTSSSVLAVSTADVPQSSAGAGPVVGGILAVLAILGACAVIIYIVMRRRRGRRSSSPDKCAKEPMLGRQDNGKTNVYEPVNPYAKSYPIPLSIINNNADQLENHRGKTGVSTGGAVKKNPDGLIYADLDLGASRPERPVLGGENRVDYETIDFTRRAPPPPPGDIELNEEDEELQ